ncbi:hypothetical protein EON77_18235, partial [bacterium]
MTRSSRISACLAIGLTSLVGCASPASDAAQSTAGAVSAIAVDGRADVALVSVVDANQTPRIVLGFADSAFNYASAEQANARGAF